MNDYLTVAHRWVVVTVGTQNIEESLLQTLAGCLLEIYVVWKCSVEV